MRVARLLVVALVALVSATAVAQASAEEYVAVRVGEGGRLLENFEKGAKLVIQITSPPGARECQFKEKEGKIQKNLEPLVEFRFPKLTEVGCEGGATQERFGSGYVALFNETAGLVSFTEFGSGHVKVRVGGTCLYNIINLGGSFTFPHSIDSTVSGTGKLANGAEHPLCEKEETFEATQEIKWEEEEKGVKEPTLYAERL